MAEQAVQLQVDWQRPTEVPLDLVALWRSTAWREHDREVLRTLREDTIQTAWQALRGRPEPEQSQDTGSRLDAGVSAATGIAMGMIVAAGSAVGRRSPRGRPKRRT